MPLPAIAIFGIGLVGVVTTGSVSAAAIKYHKSGKKKLKSIPRGILRPPPGMTRGELKRAAQKFRIDVTNYYNFVFCGGSGAGKSTLINALLNREDIDLVVENAHDIFGSAPTGEWQTTMSTLCYAYPEGHDLQYMRLWDTAGLGTHEYPSAKYFNEECLFAFDVIIVVAEKELGEYEYTLLENAEKKKIPTVIVITKTEEKVNAKIRKQFNTRDPPIADYRDIVQQTTDEARLRVFACLEKRHLQKRPTFVVSALKYREFLIQQDHFDDINNQQTNLRQAVRDDEHSSIQISVEVDNVHTTTDHQDPEQEIVEDDLYAKTALLAFEMNHLLDHIASVAVYRRL